MSTPERRELSVTIPVPAGWRPLLRFGTVSATLVLAALLWRRPDTALTVLWGVVVPLLPLIWYVAPGLWRSACPMAAVNRLPRALRTGRARPLPDWLRRHGYVVGVALFVFVLVARKAGLDQSGPAMAALLVALLGGALAGGVLMAGKSGWCGSLCPLRPVQGLYAREPVVSVASECRPCVGCQSDCQDLGRDSAAVRAGLRDGAALQRQRALLAGLLPGLIVGFYTTPESLSALPAIGLCLLVSLGVFFVLDSAGRLSGEPAIIVSAAVSLNLFYWFNAPLMVQAASELLEARPPGMSVWLIRENVLMLTAAWSLRTLLRLGRRAATSVEPAPRAGTVTTVRGIPIVRRDVSAPAAVTVATPAAGSAPGSAAAPAVATVTVSPDGEQVGVRPGTPLAEALDRLGLGAGAGCGQGLCGNDAVHVLRGLDATSPPSDTERRTLERLGLREGARLACSTLVQGDIEISLAPAGDDADAVLSSTAARAAAEPPRLVVVGGGIAGVTAAEQLRRLAPEAEVHLVDGEAGPLYNRMALHDLLDGSQGIEQLRLRDFDWAAERGIRLWEGCRAVELDRDDASVTLDSGRRLAYDGLILATGACARPLDVEGAGLPGVHVLRDAGDASAIAARIARGPVRRAVVVGGGPLGVETAAALRRGGHVVSLLARESHLMAGHLDEQAAALVAAWLARTGIDVQVGVEVRALWGSGRLETVLRTDGWTLPADLLVACVGVVPNVDLARAAGLDVGTGVRVDEFLRTSDPRVFAVGDVAEPAGRCAGLWAPAERQATVAARNLLGDAVAHRAQAEPMRLKVSGLDVLTIGAPGHDVPVVLDDPAGNRYRRLDATDGRLTGAVLINARRWERLAIEGVQQGVPLAAVHARVVADVPGTGAMAAGTRPAGLPAA